MRRGRGLGALAGAVLAAASLPGCSALAPGRAMALPPADGRAVTLRLGLQSYSVIRQAGATAPQAEVMRVYRLTGPAFGYDEGLLAKRVAEAFCLGYGRGLAAGAQGRFEPTGAWVFAGGCA